MIAHPLLLYSEVAQEEHQRGLSLGFFIAVCITAMTLVLFFSPSKNVPARGNHGIAHKELMLSEKAGSDGETPLQVSAFYPTPKKKGWIKEKMEKPTWAPNDKHTINGMFINGKFSKQVFDFMRYAQIDAKKNGPLSPEFQTGAQKLPVMIFSHGIRGHRHVASGLCREFTSQGFAVFSLEHNDGSAASHFDEKKLQQVEYAEEDMSDMTLW